MSLQPSVLQSWHKQNFDLFSNRSPFLSASNKSVTRAPSPASLPSKINPVLGLIAAKFPPTRWCNRLRIRSLAVNQSEEEEEGRGSINLPPGPWKLPLLGNIHQLIGPGPPHHRLGELAKTYGPVMSVQLGEVYAVVVSSAKAAKEVLRTQDIIFADRPLVTAAKIVLYNRNDIVFGSYGDQWRQMRKICSLELLSVKRVQSFKYVREEEMANFVQYLHSKAGSSVNLSHKLFSLTNSIIAITSVGKKCQNQDALLRIIDGIVEAGAGFGLGDVFPSFEALHVISGEKDKLDKLHEEADEILEDIINEQKVNRAARSSKASSDERNEVENLVDVLLDLQENGNLQVPLTNDAIKGAILDMFGAGSDTSSKTAEWALSELIKSPEAMRKAQEEVRQVFGEKGYIDEERFQELKFLKLVIKETLRLHPPVPLIPRESRKRTKINGYDIKPKTKTLVNVWAISRDPTIWPDPSKFYPERFIHSSIDYKSSNCELAPFGAGKRICPGMTLGITNLELFLAHLLYHFDWKLPNGMAPEELDMTECFGAAIKRKVDLKLIPVPVHPFTTKDPNYTQTLASVCPFAHT